MDLKVYPVGKVSCEAKTVAGDQECVSQEEEDIALLLRGSMMLKLQQVGNAQLSVLIPPAKNENHHPKENQTCKLYLLCTGVTL